MSDDKKIVDKEHKGTLARYLEENYSEDETQLLLRMLADEGLKELGVYFLDGGLDIEDILIFSAPFEDIPILMFKPEHSNILCKLGIKWRLAIGH
jgi:hypothetical protein